MTITEIRNAFRSKKLGPEDALKELAKHPVVGNKAAETLLDEILEMKAEPVPMTDGEREVAEVWENTKRGEE